jgi:hypothetical protein
MLTGDAIDCALLVPGHGRCGGSRPRVGHDRVSLMRALP